MLALVVYVTDARDRWLSSWLFDPKFNSTADFRSEIRRSCEYYTKLNLAGQGDPTGLIPRFCGCLSHAAEIHVPFHAREAFGFLNFRQAGSYEAAFDNLSPVQQADFKTMQNRFRDEIGPSCINKSDIAMDR